MNRNFFHKNVFETNVAASTTISTPKKCSLFKKFLFILFLEFLDRDDQIESGNVVLCFPLYYFKLQRDFNWKITYKVAFTIQNGSLKLFWLKMHEIPMIRFKTNTFHARKSTKFSTLFIKNRFNGYHFESGMPQRTELV